MSSESSCALRLARHSQNAWARHVERVELCRVESSRAKWNFAYTRIERLHSILMMLTNAEISEIFNEPVSVERVEISNDGSEMSQTPRPISCAR